MSLFVCAASAGERSPDAPAGTAIASAEMWDATKPRGKTRRIAFTTDEGTMMSVSASLDGEWLSFDLLGQIYPVPTSRRRAVCLTPDSGIALNFHPAVAPKGDAVAFVSDRSGQNGLWLMDPDGSHPRALFVDPESRISEPAWAPDGTAIAAVRAFPTPGRGWHAQTARLWLFSLDGKSRELLGDMLAQFNSPAFSSDGRYLYFHVSYEGGNRYGTQSAYHLERMELSTGRREILTPGFPKDIDPGKFKAADWNALPAESAAEIAPQPSPDGHYLAFARQMPGSMSYRGHTFNHRTALWVRDLRTDQERLLLDPITTDLTSVHAMYSYRVLPGYAWSGDSASLILTVDGKLQRLNVERGRVSPIPFVADVDRTISEQTRSHITIDDHFLTAKFLQWPASSPDSKKTAFVSAGRIWLISRSNPVPHELVATAGVQLTPAWSPDGKRLAFATWDDRERGRLWTVAPDGTGLRQLTATVGEFINPAWSPDGRYIVVAQGPGPTAKQWDGWRAGGAWSLVRIRVSTREEAITLAKVDIPGPSLNSTLMAMLPQPSFGLGGRVYYQDQANMGAALGLFQPFPSEAALAQYVLVRSVDINGKNMRVELQLPAAMGEGSRPVIAPSGQWVAYQADQEIYVANLPRPSSHDVSHLKILPNEIPPGTIRVGDRGGLYHHWAGPRTLEFASGNRLVRYEPATDRVDGVTVNLRIPRRAPVGSIALKNARIITMGTSEVIERGSIIVRGSRLACVGECVVADVDQVIDATGMTVMPGLVDVHAHNAREPSGVVPRHRPHSAAYLAYGVTTTVDPAIFSAAAFPLADLTEVGYVVGPRIETTAEIIASPSAYMFGDKHEIRTYQDAVRQVERRVAWGAISIKNYRQTRREQHQMLIAAALDQGITVTGEGGPLFFDLALAMDGQTGWEHLLAPLPLRSDATRFFGQATMVYSPTVSVAGHPRGSFGYFRAHHDFATDKKYQRFVPLEEIQTIIATSQKEDPDLANYSFPIVAEGLADIIHAGGRGAIGEHKEQPGIGCHWELWAYSTALSNYEALQVATLDGAFFLGLEQELGSISVGKIADLVILNANPLERIDSSLDIRYVMKAGVLYEAETLDEVWPHHQAFGPAPWEPTGN